MKRLFLSSLLVCATAHLALGYVNDGTVSVPTQNPSLIQLDTPDGIFVNHGSFSVDTSLFQISSPILYSTTDTVNYTNTGVMNGTPGFDFETFPASVGQAHPAANFVNQGNGLAGGEIHITGFANIPITGSPFENLGGPILTVRATNVINSGLIDSASLGLVDIKGSDLDMRHGRISMVGGVGIPVVDQGWDVFGSTNLFPWQPGIELTATNAITSEFLSRITGFFNQMAVGSLPPVLPFPPATVYFQSLNPPVVNSNIVWRIIYLQDFSPTNVSKNVYFGISSSPDLGNGEFHVEWVGRYRDPVSRQIRTNYLYLSDDPAARRATNFYIPNSLLANAPVDFTAAESPTPQTAGLTATPPTPPASFVNPAPALLLITNDFSYVSLKPTAVPVDTNSIVGGSPTNLPGRIQLSASDSMNLSDVQISGSSYLRLDAPVNLVNYSNASIGAAYSDLNIGVTNGSLTISNLLLPILPVWTGVPTAPNAVFGFSPMDGLQAWSGSFLFVDANGFTNDVRVMVINSGIQPSFPSLEKDVFTHAPNSLTISDPLNIFGTLGVDATALTIKTNADTAFSLIGGLNLLSPEIFWSQSLTNLQYLTNFGVISTVNLANFAGNMTSPYSLRANATPYQAFVNHGVITNQGTFIKAKYFENSGTISEVTNNSIDIEIDGASIATNSTFNAPFGSVTLAGGSLFLSNGVINAGQSLTLNASCSLSDGYVFGNQFGHTTNATPRNVVTNGNNWIVNGGVQIPSKPPTADLLGTTITNNAVNGLNSINIWAGEDRGASPGGFATNLALGRMILNADQDPTRFTFGTLTGSNALYVDEIVFQGSATNTDANGNLTAVTIQPGMKIYYAQALINGASVAEKLNGKNGGGFCWVSNYAGVYSSTNILYPDNQTYIFNEALAISPDIASGGPDGTHTNLANVSNPYPIPTNWVFDIVNIGPQPCNGDGGGGTGGGGSGDGGNGSGSQSPSILSFPATESGGSGSVTFSIAQGSYNGLFYETNGVRPSSSGSFVATVTSKGGFSAKLQLGSQTYSLSKAFDASGHFSGNVTGKGLATLTMNLQLVNNDQITGQVSSGSDWTAQLLANRAAKNPVPLAWVGKDTLVLSNVVGTSAGPVGDGYGSVTVSKSGTVQWSGLLPDGSKVTQKSALSKDGVWPLYSAPYGGSGSFLGWMQFTNGNEDINGSAVWIVPAGNNALYPNGVTNELNATGSSLTGSIGTPGHRTVVLNGVSVSSTNDVVIIGKNGQSSTVKLSVNPATGLFTGTVYDAGSSQTLSFQGALLEKSGIGGGFFLNADKSQGGKVYLAPAN